MTGCPDVCVCTGRPTDLKASSSNMPNVTRTVQQEARQSQSLNPSDLAQFASELQDLVTRFSAFAAPEVDGDGGIGGDKVNEPEDTVESEQMRAVADEIFDALDRNSDGTLTRIEVVREMKSARDSGNTALLTKIENVLGIPLLDVSAADGKDVFEAVYDAMDVDVCSRCHNM